MYKNESVCTYFGKSYKISKTIEKICKQKLCIKIIAQYNLCDNILY